jgi:hypothetical protein
MRKRAAVLFHSTFNLRSDIEPYETRILVYEISARSPSAVSK